MNTIAGRSTLVARGWGRGVDRLRAVFLLFSEPGAASEKEEERLVRKYGKMLAV